MLQALSSGSISHLRCPSILVIPASRGGIASRAGPTRKVGHSYASVAHVLADLSAPAQPYKLKRSIRPGSPRRTRISYKSSIHSSSNFNNYMETSVDVSPEVWKLRTATLHRVQKEIRRSFGDQYSVKLFGSTRYGVSLPKSDLDMVIIDPARPTGFDPRFSSKFTNVYRMRIVADALGRAGFKIIQTIATAQVPIVKFVDPKTGLHCDINVNERLGLLNSVLIYNYCNLSSYLRPMLMYIKRWATPLGLNQPSNSTGPVSFSSYALALMTIAFLQTRSLLPNIQSGFPPLPPSARYGVFWPRNPKLCCDTRFHDGKGWTHPILPTLHPADVMKQWFQFWGDEFNPSESVASVRHGGIITRRSILSGSLSTLDIAIVPMLEENVASGLSEEVTLQRTIAHHSFINESEMTSRWNLHQLCVADPFIRTKNVTMPIGHKSLAKFQAECRRAASAGVHVTELIDFPLSYMNSKSAGKLTVRKFSYEQMIDGGSKDVTKTPSLSSEDSVTCSTSGGDDTPPTSPPMNLDIGVKDSQLLQTSSQIVEPGEFLPGKRSPNFRKKHQRKF